MVMSLQHHFDILADKWRKNKHFTPQQYPNYRYSVLIGRRCLADKKLKLQEKKNLNGACTNTQIKPTSIHIQMKTLIFFKIVALPCRCFNACRRN